MVFGFGPLQCKIAGSYKWELRSDVHETNDGAPILEYTAVRLAFSFRISPYALSRPLEFHTSAAAFRWPKTLCGQAMLLVQQVA